MVWDEWYESSDGKDYVAYVFGTQLFVVVDISGLEGYSATAEECGQYDIMTMVMYIFLRLQDLEDIGITFCMRALVFFVQLLLHDWLVFKQHSNFSFKIVNSYEMLIIQLS